ncbi:adenosine deaminase [Streptomyces sp. RS10V-4]|uniref:adenosine deaminase n=1 Tax=Streptomyces rhizoryzae TaxID=2932493 RepID=UPI0020030FAD|nr:adenosine deaminase [Streptomyces rhizoryzae]MCK7622182.1 adenosine deaminase [Streptomyces rhizoryzae]
MTLSDKLPPHAATPPATSHTAPTPAPGAAVAGSARLLDREQVRRAPKVLLHDHLDGGLRPQTIIELAEAIGYRQLPVTEPAALAEWFRRAADSGSLERYLETFAHTCAVMQTGEALFRIAAECAEDLAADGVVYAEVRYAPEQHLAGGLTLDEVVETVNAGFREGERRAAAAGRRIRVGTLLCAMRHADRAREIAELAVAHRDRGVAGFDIAGGEIGNPASRHADAFDYLRSQGARITVHAGEAVGAESIHQAVLRCGAHRIGHGVRITDDLTIEADGTVRLGRLASYVRDMRIALEVCPTSNLQTGAATSYPDHPIDLLRRLGFRVCLNTDNRLVSGTTMTQEFQHLADTFGYGANELEALTLNAAKAAFLPYDQRTALINEVIRPGYARLRAGELSRVPVRGGGAAAAA